MRRLWTITEYLPGLVFLTIAGFFASRLLIAFYPSEPFAWLTLSADMGYMAAQLQYYHFARIELVMYLALKEPDLIYVYRDRARAYLENLLYSGHPEAPFRMAGALMRGDIYPRDYKLALAYTLVAKRQGYDSRETREFEAWADGKLTMRESNEAREMARKLCESLCGPAVAH